MYSVYYMYHTSYTNNTLDSFFQTSLDKITRGFSVIDWVRRNLERDIAMALDNSLFIELPVSQIWKPIFIVDDKNSNYSETNATKMILDFITLIPSVRKTDFSHNIVNLAEKCNNLIYSFSQDKQKLIVEAVLDYFKNEPMIVQIVEYISEISKYYKLNYNIPDTPSLYFSRYDSGSNKGQLKEQTDEIFKEYLRNFQYITIRNVGIPLLSDHIETCFTNVLQHIIKLIKEKFIEDTSDQPLEEERVNIDDSQLIEDSVTIDNMKEQVINTNGSKKEYTIGCEHCHHLYTDPDEEIEFFCDYCNPDFLKDIVMKANANNNSSETLEEQYSNLDNSLYSCIASVLDEFNRYQLIFLDKNSMCVSKDIFDTINKLYQQCGIVHKFKYINNPDNIITKDTIEKYKTFFNKEFYNEHLSIEQLVQDLKDFNITMKLEKKYNKTIIEVSKSNISVPKPYFKGCDKCGVVCYCSNIGCGHHLPKPSASVSEWLPTIKNAVNLVPEDLLNGYRKAKEKNDFSDSVQPISEVHMGSWINEQDSMLETADNYGYLAEQWKADLADTNNIYKSINIFYIHSSSQTIVCIDLVPDIVNFINQYLTDFELVASLETIGENMTEKLNDFFHCKEFDSLEEAKNKFVSFSTLYNLSNNTQASQDEKHMIMGYIKSNYNLSKDPAKRMKASVIQKEIETALREFIGTPFKQNNDKDFAKRISSYLLELDLNKKRFSDGIYYYGIEPRKIVETYEQKLASYNNIPFKPVVDKTLKVPPLQPWSYH